MYKKLLQLFLFLLILCCGKDDTSQRIPECIQELKNAWEPPLQIYRYHYKGYTVYYFPPQCCDMFSTLYDENCNVICSPDGGYTGGGDGRCPDFFSERKDEELISVSY